MPDDGELQKFTNTALFDQVHAEAVERLRTARTFLVMTLGEYRDEPEDQRLTSASKDPLSMAVLIHAALPELIKLAKEVAGHIPDEAVRGRALADLARWRYVDAD